MNFLKINLLPWHLSGKVFIYGKIASMRFSIIIKKMYLFFFYPEKLKVKFKGFLKAKI